MKDLVKRLRLMQDMHAQMVQYSEGKEAEVHRETATGFMLGADRIDEMDELLAAARDILRDMCRELDTDHSVWAETHEKAHALLEKLDRAALPHP